MSKNWLRAFSGELLDTTNHKDKLVATLGAVCAIYAVVVVSAELMSGPVQGLVVASMGASAVLLFAVPHGALSQPWPLIGGHLTGGLIGVTSALFIGDLGIASAVAVALTIAGMHYLRCIHPPAGATALFAVLGGAPVHALGYGFVLYPVLTNVAVMLVIAVVFNFPFAWRRYPAAAKYASAPDAQTSDDLDATDLEHAMREMNLHMDITEEDLARLYRLAKLHHETAKGVSEDEVLEGDCYSNDLGGYGWSVRQVLREAGPASDDIIGYWVVAGEGAGHARACPRREFAAWAAYRIVPAERFQDALQPAQPEATG